MTARALLVPDCGTGVGLGHLERMLALADALRPEFAASVVVPTGDAALYRRVVDRGHIARDAPGSTASRAVWAAVDGASDVIVLDGYIFDVATQQRLREHGPLIVVDDLGHPTACDLAVNPSPGSEPKHPEGADGFLGGAAFALLPAALLEARDAVQRTRHDRRVLVSTGATDLQRIAKRVVDELLRRDPAVEVVAVAGPDMDPHDLPDHPRLSLMIEPASLAGALASATVYVGAAGTTALQAACVGVPAVITAVAANQHAQAAALVAAGCAVVVAPKDLAAECLALLDDPSRSAEMARIGRQLIDGCGAARVAASIRHLVRATAAR